MVARRVATKVTGCTPPLARSNATRSIILLSFPPVETTFLAFIHGHPPFPPPFRLPAKVRHAESYAANERAIGTSKAVAKTAHMEANGDGAPTTSFTVVTLERTAAAAPVDGVAGIGSWGSGVPGDGSATTGDEKNRRSKTVAVGDVNTAAADVTRRHTAASGSTDKSNSSKSVNKPHTPGGGGGLTSIFAKATAAFGAADSASRGVLPDSPTELPRKVITSTADSPAAPENPLRDVDVAGAPSSATVGVDGAPGDSEPAALPAVVPSASLVTSDLDASSRSKQKPSAIATDACTKSRQQALVPQQQCADSKHGSGKLLPAGGGGGGGGTSSISSSSSSPCLVLAAEHPCVFAATLADDVLDSLRAGGAAAAGGERWPGKDEEARAGSRVGGAGGEEDAGAAVARAVEALLRDGEAREGTGVDFGAVDAAEKVRPVVCVDGRVR